jgi:hypothetical protein
MFTLADPDRIIEVLTNAGFEHVHSNQSKHPQVWGQDAAEFFLTTGPARFIPNHVDQPTQNRARSAATAALRSYQESDGVRLRGAAWLVTATRPKQ